LKKSLKNQEKGVGLMIDAMMTSSEWDAETRTMHKIALDLAIRALDLLHKQLNREFLEK
jgi:hypothetical protein